MDNVTLDIAKFIAGLISTTVTVIIYLGKRQERVNRQIRMLEDRVVAMDKQSAEDRAAIRENVQRLREKLEQERIDFKERLKEMAEYLYNRPR